MRSNKHVLLLTPGFPRDEADDTCIPALQDFVLALREAGQKISVISIQYPGERGEYSWHGIPVYSAGGKNRKWRRIFTWARVRKAIRKVHEHDPVDVIHSFWKGEAAMLGRAAAGRYRIRHLNTLMGQDALPSNHYHRLVGDFKIPTISLSPFHASIYQKSTGQKAHKMIPWGLKTQNKVNQSFREIHLLGVGSLIPLKRFHEMVEVAKELKGKVDNLRIELIGEGPERERIEGLIRENKLGQIMQIRGKLSRAVVLEKMQNSQVLLHFSEYESFGLVMAEAIRAGMAVVSRPVGAATFPGVAPSERWAIARDPAEFARFALGFLRKPPPPLQDFHPFPIQATVDAYLEIYQS